MDEAIQEGEALLPPSETGTNVNPTGGTASSGYTCPAAGIRCAVLA